jgi:hypothetical protein
MSPLFEGHFPCLEELFVMVFNGRCVAQKDVEAFHFGEDCGTCAALSSAEDYNAFHSDILFLSVIILPTSPEMRLNAP